jgi:hypothetical protein
VGDRLQVSATMFPTTSPPAPASSSSSAAAMAAARSSECSVVHHLSSRAWCVAQIIAGTGAVHRSAVHTRISTYLARSCLLRRCSFTSPASIQTLTNQLCHIAIVSSSADRGGPACALP